MSFQDFNTTIQTAFNETSILNASNDHLTEVSAVAPVAKLKAKNKRLQGVWALPFTAPSPRTSNTPYWVVPATGGYIGGCNVGRLMADSYSKYLRDNDVNGGSSSLLGIVSSMAIRLENAGGEAMAKIIPNESYEYESLKGQMVGFFNSLEMDLALVAKKAGGSLDSINHKDQMKTANKYLAKEVTEVGECL